MQITKIGTQEFAYSSSVVGSFSVLFIGTVMSTCVQVIID